jgi:hypothetical protein
MSVAEMVVISKIIYVQDKQSEPRLYRPCARAGPDPRLDTGARDTPEQDGDHSTRD